MDMVTRTSEGAEVYLTAIDEETDTFLKSLDNPEKVTEPQAFTAMLNYLYNSIFKPQPANWSTYEQNRYHSRQRSILDYDDCTTLDAIWNCYIRLCVRFDQIPTMLDFSVLTGIRNDEFTRWINGTARSKSDEHCRTAKRWKQTCEAALAKRAIQSNSIGAIFALKAAHGWRETAPAESQGYITSGVQSTPEEIMERYANAKRPELPQLD